MTLTCCGPKTASWPNWDLKHGKEGVLGDKASKPKQGLMGSRCSVDEDCQQGLNCLRGTCSSSPVIAYVVGCKDDLDCAFPFLCIFGVCMEKGAVAGEACVYDSDCMLMHACVQGACVPLDQLASSMGIDYPTGCQPGIDCFTDPTTGHEVVHCDSDADCASGQGCYMDVCQMANGAGDVGSPCERFTDCNLGLTCLFGACTRRLVDGSWCLHVFDCEVEQECIAGACAHEGMGPGKPCSQTSDCMSETDVVVCLEGSCTPVGEGQEGDVCEIADDCHAPLVCNSYRCAGFKAKVGEPCLADDHCEEGLFCVTGACAASLLPVGAACTLQLDCETELCVKGQCKDYIDIGEKCVYNTECLSLTCVNGRCAEERQGLNAKCKKDKDCEIPLVCIDERCRDHRSDVGDPCSMHADCIPGLSCKLGRCHRE